MTKLDASTEVPSRFLKSFGSLALCAGMAFGGSALAAGEVVDLGSKVPAEAQIREGLFPEEACQQVLDTGYKCMGFKPAVRFSMPSAYFKIGSAELPSALQKQLDVFAKVLSQPDFSSRTIEITGHADASGSDELNDRLSASRAKGVRNYLVKRGVPSDMLVTSARGSRELADSSAPYSEKNRRIEIGRRDLEQAGK